MFKIIIPTIIAGLILAFISSFIKFLVGLITKKKYLKYLLNGLFFIIFTFFIYFIYIKIFLPIPKIEHKNLKKISQTYKKDFANIYDTIKTLKIRLADINTDHLINNTNYTDAEKEYLEDIRNISDIIIGKLTRFNDIKLTWAYRELKYDFLSYIYALNAEVEVDSLKKLVLISKSLENADKALNIYYLCDAIMRFSSPDSFNYDFKKLSNFFTRNNNYSRLLFIKAWMYSLQYRMGFNKNGCIIAKYLWNKIKENYRKKWPLNENPSLNFCYKNCWKNNTDPCKKTGKK